MKIYVKFEIPETLGEFLKLFFSNEGYEYTRNVETYANKECTMVQCQSGRNRSFDDLLDCVNTYYPEVLPEELMEAILSTPILYKGTPRYPFLMCCGGIKRIVILYYRNDGAIPFTADQYQSKWSWKELLGKVGIRSEQEYYAYIEKNYK